MFERTQILFALSEPVTITSDSFFAAPPTAFADGAPIHTEFRERRELAPGVEV